MAPNPITRLRELSLALPGAHEIVAWGEPTFRVRNRPSAAAVHLTHTPRSTS
jgi:hypothetical protein